jgi:hypothetical protein
VTVRLSRKDAEAIARQAGYSAKAEVKTAKDEVKQLREKHTTLRLEAQEMEEMLLEIKRLNDELEASGGRFPLSCLL